MPNIKLSYLYRDSANYKTFGYAVFANPNNLTLEAIAAHIRTKLIYDQFFYANEWQLPDLFPTTFNPYDDPTWHEFESIALTNEPATLKRPCCLFNVG
jgi:hypothetical protein